MFDTENGEQREGVSSSWGIDIERQKQDKPTSAMTFQYVCTYMNGLLYAASDTQDYMPLHKLV